MGTTDRPDLELSLRKGDIVTVIGSMGPDGYYTAILPNGKFLTTFLHVFFLGMLLSFSF